MIQTRAQTIRDRFYAGDCTRARAEDCLVALICEYLEPNPEMDVQVRRRQIAEIVSDYMEPAV